MHAKLSKILIVSYSLGQLPDFRAGTSSAPLLRQLVICMDWRIIILIILLTLQGTVIIEAALDTPPWMSLCLIFCHTHLSRAHKLEW